MELDPRQPQTLTPELIAKATNFVLVATFTGFELDDGAVSPELHEERERLLTEYGEDNVLPSFFIENNKVQLGLFLRHVELEIPEFAKDAVEIAKRSNGGKLSYDATKRIISFMNAAHRSSATEEELMEDAEASLKDTSYIR
jgi:single-stranded DNA-specific DHH superfamily exonuclease